MAQTQSPTKEGYGEMCRLICGEETVADNAVKSVVCIKTGCTADEDQTYAGITKCTETGVSIADADSVVSTQTTNPDDTVEVDHVFTAGESVTVLGFGVCNDANDKLFMLCCFNAGVALETSDTLTIEGKMQIKKD